MITYISIQAEQKKYTLLQHYRQTEQGLTSYQTLYRSYWGRVFTGQMTQPTVSKHWRKTQN